MEDSGGLDADCTSTSDKLMQPNGSCKDSENLSIVFLDDFDSYFDDINDRLTISRMVNDSIIKGMVNAVTEDAAEKIAQKELEVALLKERLQFFESGACKVKELESPSLSDDLVNLRMESEKQFNILENKLEDMKVCRLHPEQIKTKEPEKWAGVDQTLDALKNVLNTVFTKTDNVVCVSKTSLFDCQKEREFQAEVEGTDGRNSIKNTRGDYEVQLLKQRAQCGSGQSANQLAMIKQLSSLRQELNFISKAFSTTEMAQLSLNGSQEGSEEHNNGKRKDDFHHKDFRNHITQACSLRETNGKQEEPKSKLPEHVDSAQLKHMAKDELISYFRNEMTLMKRNHESLVQEKTEEYFSLRREFLKEKGSSFSLRREKEFETFRKKIPEVIVKLDNMLMENQNLPVEYENNEIICSLTNRIDTLLSENLRMKELLINKSKEVRCLMAQVSNAADRMSHHSLAEANLLKQIRKLKCDIEDKRLEVLIGDDVWKCILKEFIANIKCTVQECDMETEAMLDIYEILFRGFALDAKATIKCDIEDSDLESIIMQEIFEIIFREAAKDGEDTIRHIKMVYNEENQRRVSLEALLLESEKTLGSVIEENELLKQKMLRSSELLDEKEKLALEKGSLLMKEKERCNLIYQELNLLKNEKSQKERLVSEGRRESSIMKSKLEEALGKVQLYEKEIIELDQRLKGAYEEIKKLHGIVQVKESALSLLEAKETEHKKQYEPIIASVQRLFQEAADFDHRTMEVVEKNNLRLKRLQVQLDPLIQNATLSRSMEVVYKQRLERRYSDLQKAEAEVDLLGDEVDTLLSLLEKIYIALYHYSPVLQHYPGVMDTLKLIKRELNVEIGYNQKK
ncbi:Wpp domain-associated protein [Thalictrum thalictroides]|uniref:Wpp domain-associated protein n=1 Tax=Thalictrum thalictroides TaxID=46969 RepID=A0A7J6W3U1_THATH|nr:Wpp domain-associated protein [Thalictrum thalictroides]